MHGSIYNMAMRNWLETKILVRSHKASASLKREIRKTVRHYAELGMHLTLMYSRGAAIFLRLRRMNAMTGPRAQTEAMNQRVTLVRRSNSNGFVQLME